MSKRLNKRQQREQEELEQLKAIQQAQIATDSEEEEGDEEDVNKGVDDGGEVVGKAGKGPVNPFDALDNQPVGEDDSDEEATPTAPKKSKKKKNKKKKKPSSAAAPAPDEPVEEDEALDAEADAEATDETTLAAPTADAAIPTGSSTPSLPTSKPAKSKKSNTATPNYKSNPKSGKGAKKAGVDDGMDEIDRALAELGMKAGESSTAADGSAASGAAAGAGKGTMAGGAMLGFRQMLSVDPKNLDADAELKRFFGSKVITSSASSSRSHRPTPSSKLRYTLSKPKPNYPPSTSLAGLGMRELTEDEVSAIQETRLAEWADQGERWFTFEHAAGWREIVRQFLGAVQSHDPNTLMALLQVYPWHVDTLMQMSEVYRLQSDIGAASDYAERALYALDRCLAPSFNVSSGTCRLDFNRVENRPMFMALHRIISYLGRRGCWVTAFNFAKLLFSLDPMNDPHGAAFWLDFLAMKSGNHQWILDLFEKHSEQFPVAVFQGYPGMAYAYALACRAREDAEGERNKEKEKDRDRTRSDDALREAVLAFPQVVLPLADKLGVGVPDEARSEALLQVQVGHSSDPLTPIHLLSHIYVARSEALWKEPPIQSWFQRSIPLIIPDLHREDAVLSRKDVLRLIHTPRDPIDEHLNVPLFICRHVLCSESTSWLGFLPSSITSRSFSAHDPVPPTTATSHYNAEYFAGVRSGSGNRRSGLSSRVMGPGDDDDPAAGGGGGGMMRDFMQHIYAMVDADPANWRTALRDTMTRAMGMAVQMGEDIPGGAEAGAEGEGAREAVEQTIRVAEEMVARRERERGQGREGDGEGEGGEDMPGAFPQ